MRHMRAEMPENVENLPESEVAEMREALRILYTEAIEAPERFGVIRLFRFKALPSAVLTILPASSNLRGVIAFYLGEQGNDEPAASNVAEALDRFIPVYLQAMQDPIDHPEFVEVPASEHAAELARARAQLEERLGPVLMLSYEGRAIELPSAPKGAQDAGPETRETISEALLEFSARIMAPGLWGQRSEGPDHELIEKQSVFSLIAGGALAGLLPLRHTDQPIVWDDRGIEVFSLEDSEVTLAVLYTGDPTAAFVALNVTEDFPEEDYLALMDEASDFINDCGILIGRPEAPTKPSRFVRVTDEEQIRARFTAGIGRDDLNIDILAGDCAEDRPTDLPFEVLAQWALGMNPQVLRADGQQAPVFDQVRVFRHRDVPLATLIAVAHSNRSATSSAGCFPIEMPEEQWPGSTESEDGLSFVAPAEFVELSRADSAQQLRRALAMIGAGSALDEGYPLIGLASTDLQRILTQAVAEQRALQFQQDLLTFNGIVLSWIRGDEEELTRPASYVARHTADPEFLMIGAGFSDEHGLHSFLVANLDTTVSVPDVIKKLNEVGPEDALDVVLRHAGFEMLDSEEARAAIRGVVTRLQARQALVYDLAPSERSH